MSNIFFTADLHLNHHNIIKYCGRPFKDVLEMNETLISNWNNVVPTDGTVYVLGDVAFGPKEQFAGLISRLNGNKILIIGNHDRQLVRQPDAAKLFYLKKQSLNITVDDLVLNLNHYHPTHTEYENNLLYCHGHSHGCGIPKPNTLDVGVDSPFVTGQKEYRPFTAEEVVNYFNANFF